MPEQASPAYTDRRLPNVKELQSVVNYGQAAPAVSSEFNNCTPSVDILSGSCTTAAYWTSTSVVGFRPPRGASISTFRGWSKWHSTPRRESSP